jgi:hypothetical protein
MRKPHLLAASVAGVVLLLLTTWLAHEPVSAQDRPAPASAKWEYKVLTAQAPVGAEYYEPKLNKLGTDGWELCATVSPFSATRNVVFATLIFKRPKR